ncbi:DUF551 domain-containing protein [Escherichia coli]|uniref:DUF551 domain-containing protein n=2 Tax=Escherichia coli TaxID=562 RepID=UPI000749C16B|nr:DUF551 domain-containing protein [Escherichia coli]KUH28808.1 hypothetical protein ARC98_08380 [Escherichia coli]
MSTMTKQWLKRKIAEMEAARDEIPFGLDEDDSNTLSALRIALASLEAEPVITVGDDGGDALAYRRLIQTFAPGTKLYTAPSAPENADPVAWLWSHRKHPSEVTLVRPEDDEKAEAALWSGWSCQALYAASPAPVSVPAAMEMDDDFDSAFEHGKAVGWNAYRAAMLQAEPVSNSYELPLDYLQGHKDGLEWAAQLAEANHPQTGDWLYDDPIDLARAIRKGPDMPTVQGGNSPVTPDGWISCSEQMPSAGEQVLAYRPDAPESNDPLIKMATYVGGSAHGHGFDCYCKPTHWMPLPAAPQEVNRG